MSEKIYYIKGSTLNPEGVKQALLEVCPNAENIADFEYNNKSYYYYVVNGIIDYAYETSHIILLESVGTELEAKETEKFVEKTMYQPIKRSTKSTWLSTNVYSTIEDAMSEGGTVGYREIKIMVKE